MAMTKKAVGGLVLFVFAWSVILIAWGLDDWRGFFVHPARAGLFAVGWLTLLVGVVFRLDVQPFRRGSRPLGRQWSLGAMMLTGLSLIFFLPYGDRRSLLTFAGADGLRYLGLLLYLSGNVVGLAAVRILGKQYSGYVTLQEDHQLVQSGIYAVIRHPIYLRALVVLLGLPLVFRSWLAIPALIVGAVFVAWRIRQEEKLLAEHFGAEFDAYRRRTWRLMPYFY